MPLTPIQQLFDQAPVFALVLFRLGGLFALAPLLGSVTIPVKIKILFILILGFAVFPLVPQTSFVPSSFLHLAVSVGGELLIGITIGFALSLLFVGVQLGAEMISYQMGLGMARLIDPLSEVSTTALSQFYLLLATLLYVLMGGHLILIRQLAGSFQTIPLLSSFQSQPVIKMCLVVLREAFELGIRISGPAVVALFLASLAMGFISRTMPQLNILAAGFPVRTTLGLIMLIASLAMVGLLFQNSLALVFKRVGALFMQL